MQEARTTSRFKPLPESEKAICERLASARRFSGLSQPAFAVRIGATPAQIANIESARVPLKFEIGWRSCEILGINQYWLLTGKESERGVISFNPYEFGIERPGTALFSEVCSGAMLPHLKYHTILLRAKHAAAERSNESIASQLRAFDDVLSDALLKLPVNERPFLMAELVEATRVFRMQSKVLTATSTNRKTQGVKTELEGLLEKVRRLTKRKGMQGKLAADLNVPQSRVSEWLAGKHMPSGEITLKLLSWVKQQK